MIVNGRRTAIVAAHPDDETLGAGHCLQWLRRPILIHVTDGAPRDMRDAAENGFSSRPEYAGQRRREFLECLRTGGIHAADTIALGYIDQEASLRLVELTREIQRAIERFRIEVVLTHPYEGGHPDHDATAFAVHAACRRLPPKSRPNVMEFTSYHCRGGRRETGRFLADGNERQLILKLDTEARARKERMLACFQTQRKVVQQFGTAEERFRPAPAYDFTAPPRAATRAVERQARVTPSNFSSCARSGRQARATARN